MVGIPIRTDLLRLPAYAGLLAAIFLFALTIATIAFANNDTLPSAKTIQHISENGDKSLVKSPVVDVRNDDEIDIVDPQKIIIIDGILGQKSGPNNDDLIKNTNKPEPPPTVYSDLDILPFPARKMRELILDAARSGDINKFRPFIGKGDDMTMLSLAGLDGDPIDFLKSISGDPEGHELLAIITEILESDFVLIDEGTDQAVYVWPYYYAHSLENLTPRQRVKLFRLLTYGDYQEMESFGAYIFYRLGITPEGRWRFFVAGD